MSDNRLVSVIIPAYNAERFIQEAIDSVLKQAYRPLELLVVDNGSTDRTAAIIQSYEAPVQYLKLDKPHNPAAARNAGIAAASGHYLAFNDADDIWMPDKLTAQLSLFADDPTVDMVLGRIEEFDDERFGIPGTARSVNRASAGFHFGAMVITRKAFERVGALSAKQAVGESVEWYARAQDVGLRERQLSEVVVRRRIHDANLGIRLRNEQASYARTLKDILDRRREQGRI